MLPLFHEVRQHNRMPHGDVVLDKVGKRLRVQAGITAPRLNEGHEQDCEEDVTFEQLDLMVDIQKRRVRDLNGAPRTLKECQRAGQTTSGPKS